MGEIILDEIQHNNNKLINKFVLMVTLIQVNTK